MSSCISNIRLKSQWTVESQNCQSADVPPDPHPSTWGPINPIRLHSCRHVTAEFSVVSQEEEDGSDEDCRRSMTVQELSVTPPYRATQAVAGEEDSDRDSDPAFVSPIDEGKCVSQQPIVTTGNLHEASRSVHRPLHERVSVREWRCVCVKCVNAEESTG